jgi:hypothetical protein
MAEDGFCAMMLKTPMGYIDSQYRVNSNFILSLTSGATDPDETIPFHRAGEG